VNVPNARQTKGHFGFVAEDEPYDCFLCVEQHGKRMNFPLLDSANVEAWEMYRVICGQQRVGMDILGLDVTALPVAFDLLDIPKHLWRELYEKLMIIDAENRHERERRREMEKAKAEAKKRLK